ncbi:MAG TPA: MSMEG_0569 family flavin-dependent oxidoreductase [Stellaceae bacterium]|nr:MSMEG_0569 family flavin-dependent oxidoreductase [Stellaceae bacterium]
MSLSSIGRDAPRHFPVIIVGGGQAGLSLSWHLCRRGIEHVILERHVPGYAWRAERWDSFCLVTPNWQCRLPGFSYPGNDPHGFMLRQEIIDYLDAYIASFAPPVLSGVEVVKLWREPGGAFRLATSAGAFTAAQVVVATGGYHLPIVPRFAERLDADIVQLHSSAYRNPESVPTGAVLVVGSGQSGCQIAEDLHLAGRQVHLCVGGAPRVARRYRGKDVVEWLDLMGYYDLPVEEHPLKEEVRDKTNHYVTGRDGGRDIDLRRRARDGMRLHGRLAGIEGRELRFAPDLRSNLDAADRVAESINRSIDAYIARAGIAAPAEAPYAPVWQPEQETSTLDYRAADIRSVVWSIGFRTDFRWMAAPVFDGRGAPVHYRGVTQEEGLYFLGLQWLHSWGSGRFSGIGRDAAYLADRIAERALGASAALDAVQA